ncbi:MAG: hypothetical protein K2X03_11635 [Bryobacteraceae bacterium]|nr:hypothetical protein [Bryobacteraceae bacterium]
MSNYRLVSILYLANFLASLAIGRWGFALGWLLMAAGFLLMDTLPGIVWRASRDFQWKSPQWVAGHFCLNLAVVLLLADVLQDRLFW